MCIRDRRDAEPLLSSGDKFVGAFDVAGRAGADGHGVLTGRLEAEVVIERDYAIGLAERNAQGLGDKGDGVVVKIAERRLDGVEGFNEGVTGKAILAHGAVHDLPTLSLIHI